MKRLLMVVVGLLVLGIGSVEAAERRALQRQRGSMGAGGVGVAPTQLSGSAEWITGLSLTCTGTACAGGIYDNDEATDTPSLAALMFDIAAAANGTTYVDLTDTPIRAANGIQGVTDGNARALVVYTEQATP